jgi:hypothetical protein
MDQSAIHKIIKKGRRVTVNELVAFSEVLEVSINELLLPLEIALSRELNDLLVELTVHREAYAEAAVPLTVTIRKISQRMFQNGWFTPRLLDALDAQERAMLNLIDIALEAELAIENSDLGEFPREQFFRQGRHASRDTTESRN